MINFFEIWVSFKYLLPKTKEKFFSIITIFSFLGISLGVATLIIVMSVMNGFRDELTNKILGVNGHLKLQHFNNLKISNKDLLNEKLTTNISDIFINKIIVSQALFSKNSFSTGVYLKGVEGKYFSERKIFSNIKPSSIKAFMNNEGILIGEKLKKKLNLEIGNFVNILSSNNIQTVFGNMPRSSAFKVVGFFNTGMYEYDSALIFFPIEILQSFLNMGNFFDFYEIQLRKFDQLDQKQTQLKKNIPNYFKISDWRELNPSLFNALEVEKNVMFLILLLIIIVAAFNLISSMIILVSMKRRDIGVLRILGVRKNQILKIFIINGSIIGILGTFIGFFLGLIFCMNINEIKNFIEFFLDSNLFSEEIYFFSQLPVIINYSQIFKIAFISIFLSFISTIYPSIRASKVDPINLIKWD
ncbi:MAG: lipoprotein-releasing system transmembrane subunit LolC [Rickettsiales bacterium]|nr:lipoprotein-releasing system transmembrane subunit LolC [Rickettsiales bacterium]RPG16242.1 MAG: lipoprotein-releasing ABC transporter permease subunit [Pelagibacteraceae bacterium TMED195]